VRALRPAGIALALATLASTPAAAAPLTLFGHNLIVNGDAEAGPGAYDETVVVRVPGWTTTGNFTAVQYGAAGAFPMSDDPGPPDRRRNFFSGGPNNARSSAFQMIDVSAVAAAIDAGAVAYLLSGYIGGFADQDDHLKVVAKFLDRASRVIGKATIGPVYASDRKYVTGLFERHARGGVPPGTRAIRVAIVSVRVLGLYNDGECDDVSLELAKIH
jgi:hypothetical protein